MKFALQRREGTQPAMFPEPERTTTPSLHVCGSALSLYTRGERRKRYANKQSSFSSLISPRIPRAKPPSASRHIPARPTSLMVRVAMPGGSLPAGSITARGSGVGRYFPGQDAMRRPREQPRLSIEFLSLVRARGGRLAGLVRPLARNATRANVAQRGPIHWPTHARNHTAHAGTAARLGAARRGGLRPGVERRATAWHGGPDVAEAAPAL